MEYILEANNIEKRIKNNTLFKDVNFKLEKGKIYGLVGANGSGKSTLIKIIMGLTKSSGTITINGKNIRSEYRTILPKVSALVDSVALYDFMTAKENLRYFSLLYNTPKERVDIVLNMVNLEADDKKLVKHFSLGMRQKLGIAISLLKDPDILILDEPTNGLDPKGIIELRKLLKSFKDETIIVSTHIISEIEKISTDFLFINNKSLITKNTNSNKIKRTFRLDNYELSKKILPNNKLMTDEEVSIYIKKLTKQNINIYAVNDSSELEDTLLQMMEETYD